MVVLGVILLLVAAALVLLLVTAGTSQDVVLDLVGDQRLTTAPVWIFVAGVLTVLIAALGWMLIVRGTRRAVVRRKEMRRLRKAAASPQTAETAGTDVDDGSVQHEPDRRLVRDVHSLRADEGVDPSTTRPHPPEQDVDPEAPRHELRLDEHEARERRRQT